MRKAQVFLLCFLGRLLSTPFTVSPARSAAPSVLRGQAQPSDSGPGWENSDLYQKPRIQGTSEAILCSPWGDSCPASQMGQSASL